MINRLTSLDIASPSYSFQLAQILLVGFLAATAVAIVFHYKVKAEGDTLSLDHTIISGILLTGALTTVLMVLAQFAMKDAYWYWYGEDHARMNYYTNITLLLGLLITGFVFTYYIVQRVEDRVKKKKMASILVVAILCAAATGSFVSWASIQERKYTHEYELTLENIPEEASYELYVPSIYDRDVDKMDVVFSEDDMEGEASLSHIETEEGVLLKINGTGPLQLDFYHEGTSNRYELLSSDWRYNRSRSHNGEFLIFYNSSSDCEPVLDIYYRDSTFYQSTELWIEDTLKEECWQYVNGAEASIA
ncbi:MAG: hypothetical protein R6W73_02860 [Candidatus Saliniplasma sp.]